jgi:hypothetical protein
MAHNCPDCGRFLARSDPHEPGDYLCTHGCGVFIVCKDCGMVDDIDPDDPPADGLCGYCRLDREREQTRWQQTR